MKAIEFEHNQPGMRYEYHRTREGPNWFMCYYKGSAVARTDPKEAWRTIGVAKFTDTGKALKEWCLEMQDKYVDGADVSVHTKKEGREDTSFSSDDLRRRSEAQIEESPVENTKMIT